MSNTYKRRQKFVDRHVQGAIVLRTTTYWALCVLTVASMLFVWRIIIGPPQPLAAHLRAMWHQYSPVVVASVLLLPILITDIVAMSNRFAGPVLRLRRAMRQLADGEPVGPIRFREGDFWRDFADDFNRLQVRVQAAETGRDLPEREVPVVAGTAPAWAATEQPDGLASCPAEA